MTYESKPKPVELRLTRARQDDKSVYIGSATASELDAICKVPWMDPTLDSHEFGRSLSSASMDENEWPYTISYHPNQLLICLVDQYAAPNRQIRWYAQTIPRGQ